MARVRVENGQPLRIFEEWTFAENQTNIQAVPIDLKVILFRSQRKDSEAFADNDEDNIEHPQYLDRLQKNECLASLCGARDRTAGAWLEFDELKSTASAKIVEAERREQTQGSRGGAPRAERR